MSEFFLFIKHNFTAFLIISIMRHKNMMIVTLNILLYIIPKKFGYPNHEIHYKYRNKGCSQHSNTTKNDNYNNLCYV